MLGDGVFSSDMLKIWGTNSRCINMKWSTHGWYVLCVAASAHAGVWSDPKYLVRRLRAASICRSLDFFLFNHCTSSDVRCNLLARSCSVSTSRSIYMCSWKEKNLLLNALHPFGRVLRHQIHSCENLSLCLSLLCLSKSCTIVLLMWVLL